MFGTILTSIVTLFHLYVFWRASSIAVPTRHIPKRYIALFAIAPSCLISSNSD